MWRWWGGVALASCGGWRRGGGGRAGAGLRVGAVPGPGVGSAAGGGAAAGAHPGMGRRMSVQLLAIHSMITNHSFECFCPIEWQSLVFRYSCCTGLCKQPSSPSQLTPLALPLNCGRYLWRLGHACSCLFLLVLQVRAGVRKGGLGWWVRRRNPPFAAESRHEVRTTRQPAFLLLWAVRARYPIHHNTREPSGLERSRARVTRQPGPSLDPNHRNGLQEPDHRKGTAAARLPGPLRAALTFTLVSAPLATSKRTTPSCPFTAARCSGVEPWSLAAFTSAPACGARGSSSKGACRGDTAALHPPWLLAPCLPIPSHILDASTQAPPPHTHTPHPPAPTPLEPQARAPWHSRTRTALADSQGEPRAPG